MRHVVKQPDEKAAKPLSEPVLFILLSLSTGHRHGYGMIKDIANLSQGRVRLSTGTLYGALRRLLQDGWIEPYAQQDTSRDKQAYRLTAAGRRGLHSELLRLKQLSRAAAAALRTREV